MINNSNNDSENNNNDNNNKFNTKLRESNNICQVTSARQHQTEVGRQSHTWIISDKNQGSRCGL